MSFFDTTLRFEDIFSNPDSVLLAFFFLVFLISFEMLKKTVLAKTDTKIAGIISVIISILAVYSLREQIGGFLTLQFLFILFIIFFTIKFFLKPFWKFLKTEMGF